ncbi:MAG: hypothetical protein DBX52_07645 [Clostridiales bacterium]|nr:MAG: hypothetical protein DBX52_07645 [Clostridiales bacterium]
MNQPPFLSIIVPVYNSAQYLEENIRSIQAGDFTDYELILINDCSTDQTGALCDRLAAADARIRVIHLTKNGGAGPARNRGIDLARGHYLAFADADDLLDPTLFSSVAARLVEAPADQAVWGITENYYDESGTLISRNVLRPAPAFCKTPEEVHRAVLGLEQKTLFGYQCNHMYRRALLEEHQIRFAHQPLYEDFFFNMQVIRVTASMHLLDHAGYFYQKRPEGSLTARFVPEYFALSTARIQAMTSALQDWGVFTEEARNILGNLYFRYILSALMRNCDPRAGMSHKDRAGFIRTLRASPLYQMLCIPARPAGLPFKLLKASLRHAAPLALLLGRAVFMIRERDTAGFNRKKQIKAQ